MPAGVDEDRNRRPLDVVLEARIQLVAEVDGDHSKRLPDVAFVENIQALDIVVGEARSTGQQHYQLHKPRWARQLAVDCDSRL